MSAYKKTIITILIFIMLIPTVTVYANSDLPGVYVYYSGNNMMIFTFNDDFSASYTLLYDFTSKTGSMVTLEGRWSAQGSDISLQVEAGNITLANLTVEIKPQTISLVYLNGKLMQSVDGTELVKVSDPRIVNIAESNSIEDEEKQDRKNENEKKEDEEKNQFSNSSVLVGSYVVFGTYPQTSAGTDNSPIEWVVLDYDSENNKALLISRYALDSCQYHSRQVNITWEKCKLRSWLNDTFLNKAFTANEQKAILETTIDNSKTQGYKSYDTNGGKNTQDRVFLLSYSEAWKYFKDSNDRKCACTDYAEKQGARLSKEIEIDGRKTCWWLLRSAGFIQSNTTEVSFTGERGSTSVDYVGNAVRPAIWVDLNKIGALEIAPSHTPTSVPSPTPTVAPTVTPTVSPTPNITKKPTATPTPKTVYLVIPDSGYGEWRYAANQQINMKIELMNISNNSTVTQYTICYSTKDPRSAAGKNSLRTKTVNQTIPAGVRKYSGEFLVDVSSSTRIYIGIQQVKLSNGTVITYDIDEIDFGIWDTY